MGTGFWKNNVIGLVAMVLALLIGVKVLTQGGGRKIAFVDTQRLLTGFKEAHLVNKDIQAEDEKWKKDLKVAEDSLKSFMDSMTVKFDLVDIKKKKEMQDELAMRNQHINNFQRMNTRKMQELTQQKLAGVYEKINGFMKEYGKSKGFEIIFGTAQGSILYGEGTGADITHEVIEQLNSRYQ